MKKVFYPIYALLLLWAGEAASQGTTNPCAGKANFQFTVSNLTASFFAANTSNTQLKHRWYFGEGNTSSEAANPVFTYSGPGVYYVWHYIKDDVLNCYDSAVKEVRVGNICELLKPKFEWVRDSANQARIKFYNTSQPNPPPAGVSFKWSFGDGTSSSENSPVHIYQQPGEYEVCLIMRVDGLCEKTYCLKVVIPPSCNLQPGFIWSADASNPFKFKFTNQTIVPSAAAQARWSFGDSTFSNEWNPVHLYSQPGIYTVCLKVYISNTCVKEMCKQVVVRACTTEPNFTWQLDSVYPLRGVQFRNTTPVLTAQPLNIRWDFGDGTQSSEWNPFHKYEKAGTYRVCLKIAFFEGCTKEVCKTVVIPEPVNCERLSNFEVRLTSEPNTIKAEAVLANSSLKYVWTFGDGTGAFTPSTSHKYARPGKYTICLTVYRGENCASTTCKEIIVGPLPCNLTTLKYEYQRLNAAGNSIKFKALSNQPVLSQRWTIHRDNGTAPVTINGNDPTYTFTQSGMYKVCLRALSINGCIKEYCDTIRIADVPNLCSIQVAPNPATTQITFRVNLNNNQTVTASVIDAMGVRRSVHFFNGAQGWNSFNIGITNLPAGYYSIEVKYNGIVCTGRFQKVQ